MNYQTGSNYRTLSIPTSKNDQSMPGIHTNDVSHHPTFCTENDWLVISWYKINWCPIIRTLSDNLILSLGFCPLGPPTLCKPVLFFAWMAHSILGYTVITDFFISSPFNPLWPRWTNWVVQFDQNFGLKKKKGSLKKFPLSAASMSR